MPKMNNKWVALCIAAVGVVYTAGYVVTEANSAHASSGTAQPTTTHPAKVTRLASSPALFIEKMGNH